jgi:2-polyprenyl-3-methyl-5-hydroxy-6-metoxy-1,4-benzoquinol methylase
MISEDRRYKLAEWYDQYGIVQEMVLDANLGGFLQKGKEWIENFRSEMVFQLAGSVSGKKVLDVGCQYGVFSFYLLEKGADVTGVDISERWVARCTEEALERYPGRGVRFQAADAQDLPFGDECFDVVVCTEVVEHVDLPGKVVSEIFRVLRAGGVLVLGTPNTSSYYVRLYKLLKSVLPMKAIRWALRKVFAGKEEDLTKKVIDRLSPDVREEFDVEYGKLKEMGEGLGITDREKASIDEHLREFSSREIENMLDFMGFDVEKRTGFPYFPTYFFMGLRLRLREHFIKVDDNSWWRYHSAPQMYLRAVKRRKPLFPV